MNKIVLIGGTGFIGKHLCEKLRDFGTDIISFSRNPDQHFLRNHTPKIKGLSIDHDYFADHVTPFIEEALTLVYMASTTFPASSHDNAELELETNLNNAIRCFSRAVRVNPKIKIIFLSSGGTVYGHGYTQPISESNPTNPTTPYAFGKVTIENYLKFLSSTTSATYSILRPGNPVGKWQSNPLQGFIGASITRILNNQPIELFGTGEVIRDYIDADDLADAIIKVIDNPIVTRNTVFNVGSGVGSSLAQTIDILKSLHPKNIEVNFLPRRKIDLPYNVLDPSAIYNAIRWKPVSDLKNIVEKTYQLRSDI